MTSNDPTSVPSRHGPLTVAIDGPSGSGKSSVARECARRLGLGYLDTGAMYRAVAWWCRHEGVDLADQAAVAVAARSMPLSMPTEPDDRAVDVGGTDVTAAIRSDEVTDAVSAVATNLAVREVMRSAQRELIDRLRREHGGVVAEGRDLTTVVAPDAEVRILLTASQEARLARRSAELHRDSSAEAAATTRAQVLGRDAIDSTVASFTVAADGVVTLDTSSMDLPQSIAAVLQIVAGRQSR